VKLERAVILGTVVLAALSWVLSAIRDWLLHYDATFWQLLITDVPTYEWYPRLLVVAVVLATGAIVYRAFSRRKAAEKALQEGEERYRMLAENVRDVIIATDEDLRPAFVSASMEQLTGFTAEEALKRTPEESMTPESLRAVAETYATVMASQAGDCTDTSRPAITAAELYHKNGGTVSVEATTDLMRDSGGRVVGTVSVLRDITARKRVEEALQESEERFRELADLLPLDVFEFDLDGNFTYANRNAFEQSGYTQSDMDQGLNARQTVIPEDVPRMLENIEKVVRGEDPGNPEYTSVRKDGTTYSTLTSASAIVRNGQIVGFRAFSVDITERKHAEEALRESEERFRSIIENSFDGISIINSEGVVTYESPAAQSILGFAEGERLGGSVFDRIHPDDLPQATQAFENLLSYPDTMVSMTLRARHVDGSSRWIEFVGRNLLHNPGVKGIVINFRDITEHKQAEDALAESEKQYSTLVSNVADAVFRFGNGVLTWGNDRIWEMLGYEKDEMIGIDVSLFLPEEGRVKQLYSEVGTGLKEHGRFHGTTRAKRKDGSILEIEYSASPVPGKEPLELVGVARDVTQLRQMEQQLLLGGRLAAVGQLSAGVAHELNNPLAAVQGYAQFLTSRDDLEESVRSDVETIYKEAKRASKITANLLQFSRKHEPEKKPVSINEVVEDSLELNAYRMKVNNIEISTDLDPELPETMADFHQLQQVFVNLMTNAEQAMTKANGQGKLTIKTQKVDGAIKIALADNGPGIPVDVLDKVFDPFFTTKEVGEGTGLGLSICFGIIEQHGGTIGVNSKEGKGATFTVELPVTQADPVPAEQTDSNLVDQP
jgi:PAS domain S-box-containing protein